MFSNQARNTPHGMTEFVRTIQYNKANGTSFVDLLVALQNSADMRVQNILHDLSKAILKSGAGSGPGPGPAPDPRDPRDPIKWYSPDLISFMILLDENTRIKMLTAYNTLTRCSRAGITKLGLQTAYPEWHVNGFLIPKLVKMYTAAGVLNDDGDPLTDINWETKDISSPKGYPLFFKCMVVSKLAGSIAEEERYADTSTRIGNKLEIAIRKLNESIVQLADEICAPPKHHP